MAFCATADFLYIGLQNASREGSMRHQVRLEIIMSWSIIKQFFMTFFRCIQSIMYLLKMASNQQPAADDLVPVLIYVIIKVRIFKFV